jgi:SPP1 gp7 family putative phage head morphogenesis protein
VDIYTGRIRAALNGSMDTRALAEAWQALHPKVLKGAPPGAALAGGRGSSLLAPRPAGPDQRDRARTPLTADGHATKARGPSDPFILAFLRRALPALTGALQAVLGKLWPEAQVLGQLAAEAVVAGVEADWRGWAPGDHQAAEAIAGAELRRLLDQSGIRVKLIAETRLEELADVLEATLASDVTAIPAEGPQPPVLSVGDLARQLEAVLDNPERAELVAWTEISRAQGEAARTVYAEAGYPEVDWITAMDARVCPACDAAMASNPHPLGAPPVVPMHPRCRCAEIPALVGNVS